MTYRLPGRRPRAVIAELEPKTATARRRALALLDTGRAESDAARIERPVTRGQCVNGMRPCPWQGCRHHLALEVTAVGTLKINNPDEELEDMLDTCALDVADRGPTELTQIGRRLNITREGARQIMLSAGGVLRAKVSKAGVW